MTILHFPSAMEIWIIFSCAILFASVKPSEGWMRVEIPFGHNTCAL